MVLLCFEFRSWWWYVGAFLILILEGLEIGLGFLVLGLRELGEKTPFMRFFRGVFGDHSRPRVWKRLRFGVPFVGEDGGAGERQLHDHLDLWVLDNG